jgi:hypothetical protein
MADGSRLTTDLSPPTDSPVSAGVRMLEKRPNYATLCHFFAPPGRLSGDAAGSASRGRIMGSDVKCGRPGHPQAEWHRCTESATAGAGCSSPSLFRAIRVVV